MLFLRRWEGWLAQCLSRNAGAGAVVLALFGLGIVLGALAVRMLDPEQAAGLTSYLHGYLTAAGAGSPQGRRVAWATLGSGARTLVILWALGITVLGLPGVLFIMLVQGFATGFAVAFLLQELGEGRGAVASFALVLLPGALRLPALLLGGIAAVSFSGRVVHQLLVGRRGGLAGELVRYTVLVAMLGVPMAGAGLLAGYAGPFLLHLAGRLLARA
ncbi:MAG: stage II sporulation protein M [Thermaerobacter sp.]|nr:stage II sporulation protein M [Thermaerobacter sp.]